MEKKMKENLSRRSFFQMFLGVVAVAPIIMKSTKLEAATSCGAAPAGKKAAVVGVGMAKSLDYVEDATQSKNAKYVKGSDCGNCKYYQDKKAAGSWAPCTMMGMSFVASCGWCKSYMKK